MASDSKPERKPAPGTVQERQQRQREEKLEQIREQVESGSLVIRKMTPDERKKNPAQNRSKKRSR